MSATLFDTVLTPVLFLTFGKKPLDRLAAAQPTCRRLPKPTSEAKEGSHNVQASLYFTALCRDSAWRSCSRVLRKEPTAVRSL